MDYSVEFALLAVAWPFETVTAAAAVGGFAVEQGIEGPEAGLQPVRKSQ